MITGMKLVDLVMHGCIAILFISTAYVAFRVGRSAWYRSIFALRRVISDPHCQPFGRAYARIPTTERVVALTFDDGPLEPYTSELLTLLSSLGVPATFFVVGENVRKFPRAITQMLASGHQLGNHSYSHRAMIGIPLRVIRDEIESTDSALRELGVTGAIDFRAPFGKKLIRLPWTLFRLNKRHILFDFFPRPRDWSGAPVEDVARSIVEQTRPGSIIVLHDGNRHAAPFVCAYTSAVVSALREQGYKFVRVDELIAQTESAG